MRRFAVIGLGHFGFNVAKRLYEDGHEVIAIDKEANLVEEVKEYSTEAVVGDASDREALKAVGIGDVDVAVVCMGNRLDVSLLVTLYLKEMGVEKIVVKALSDDHAKVLKAVGATDIIFPEKDMAIRVAERLSTPTVLDQVEFMEGYSVVEIEAPKTYWGVALKDTDIRHKYGLSLILIRRGGPEGEVLIAPMATDLIGEGDVLVLLGEDANIEKFKAIT